MTVWERYPPMKEKKMSVHVWFGRPQIGGLTSQSVPSAPVVPCEGSVDKKTVQMFLSVKTISWASSLDVSSLGKNKRQQWKIHRITQHLVSSVKYWTSWSSYISRAGGHLQSQLSPVSGLRDVSQLLVTLAGKQHEDESLYSSQRRTQIYNLVCLPWKGF